MAKCGNGVLNDEARATMAAINGRLSHTRSRKAGARYFRYQSGQGVVEVDRPSAVMPHSMFPYYSDAMACEPEDVAEVKEVLKAHGVSVDFDDEGRPKIESTKQHQKIAKALGMFSPRDGFGHEGIDGTHQLTGRPRAAEMAEGRRRNRRFRGKLEQMPDDVGYYQVEAAAREVAES